MFNKHIKSFQYGVMAYQIRYREMIGIKEYLKRGLNIFPTFKCNSMKVKTVIITSVAAAAV